MGTNKFSVGESPAGSQGSDEMEMYVNMLRQGHLQKLHITYGEVIQILEQGCFMSPEKGQGNKKIQIKERTPRMILVTFKFLG